MARLIQIPRPSFDDNFSACVAAGDCQQVRELFDQAFWDGYKIFPTWDHLKTALHAENKPMLKLLVAWGARPDDEGLTWLGQREYRHYAKLLRQCGLKLSVAAQEETPHVEPEAAPLTAEQIPKEWRLVLQAVQDKGAPEAVIAGGALRDLFNGRAVKDVDIFLKTRGSKRKNKAFLTEVFKEASLGVDAQMDYSASYFGILESFPPPKDKKLTLACSDVYATVFKEGYAESWTVIAGPQRTEYNIIFVDNVAFKDLPTCSGAKIHSQSFDEEYFKWSLIQGFDLGLCQTAFNGRGVVTTPSYNDDVKNRRISLREPNKGSKEHLERIAKKYPDWKLCAESKKLLAPKRGFWPASGSGVR